MSVFFNGQELITPAVASAVNDSALLNTNPNVGNVLAIIGPCSNGAPNTALVFGDPTTAVNALGVGDLADAVQRAFNPSQDVPGPASVIAIRVNPAVQSTLTLNDQSSSPVINLASADFGGVTNGLSASVGSGSVQGKFLTVSLAGGPSYTKDNVYSPEFTIQYSGVQTTAQMSITNSTVVLSAPSGTPVATLALSTFQTVAQLVAAINAVAGFSASVVSGAANDPALNGLDTVTNQDVKTAQFTATATLQAIVDWFTNGQPLVNATRVSGAGTLPANVGTTFFGGGSDGAITNTQWSNAFTLLQGLSVQWITPCSGSASIIAMAEAHCAFMSTTGRRERRAICGMTLGTSDAQALTEALAIGSDRVGLVHLGGYDFNAAGALTLYPPYIVAAMVAGGFAGSSPGTPMTNKRLNLQGMERVILEPTNTDPLIQGGVMPVAPTEDGSIRVIQSISTWLTDKAFDKVELSTGAALDATCMAVRTALTPYKGQENSPALLGLELSTLTSTLTACAVPAPNGPGLLVGDANSPAFKNASISLNGDVTSAQFQCSPGVPNNYVLVTVYAQPYSGSASAS